jgi:hypothetical protein
VDDVIYTKDGKHLIFCAPAKAEVTLLDGVEYIYSGAFADCHKLTSIVIPASVRTIEYDTFGKGIYYTSYTLESVYYGLPDSVYDYYIRKNSNDYNSILTSVTFENPNGWILKRKKNTVTIYPDGTSTSPSFGNTVTLSAEELSDPTRAAEYLKSQYVDYEWNRTEG